MDLNLNKREFKYSVNLRCDWQISDVPNVCVCGDTCVSGRSIFGIIYKFEKSVIVNKKQNYDGKGQ